MTILSMTPRALFCVLLLVLIGCNKDPELGPARSEDPDTIADSPEELVDLLALAYRSRDVNLLASLLADGVEVPLFCFFTHLDEPLGDKWGYHDEMRLHQRMFEPQNTHFGLPVPTELWLRSISIHLDLVSPFEERSDLYRSASRPDGLDPARWKAFGAIYGTDLLFDTQGDLDFQVTGRAGFVVIEDLDSPLGTVGRFLLWQWDDLPGKVAAAASEQKKWAEIKRIYMDKG